MLRLVAATAIAAATPKPTAMFNRKVQRKDVKSQLYQEL
jgi:hypothetical protein